MNANLLSYPGGPHVSDGGFAFYVGTEEYNIYACGCFEYSEEGPDGELGLSSFTLQPQAVPEPALWPAVALGLGGLVARRRFTRV